MATIRVVLAEDNVLLREGVSRLVAANEDFELVGTAADLPQLLALVGEQHPERRGHQPGEDVHRPGPRGLPAAEPVDDLNQAAEPADSARSALRRSRAASGGRRWI